MPARFRSSDTTRTPASILAHIGDLMDWTLSILKGAPAWNDSRHESIGALDTFLSTGQPDLASMQRLFQGLIADAFTHVGQLTLLRRMAGSPIRGENYFIADIEAGLVASDQTSARGEFG